MEIAQICFDSLCACYIFFSPAHTRSRVKIAGYTLPMTKISHWNLLHNLALFQLRFLWFLGDLLNGLNGNRASHTLVIVCPWRHRSRRCNKLHQKELLFVSQEHDLVQVLPCEFRKMHTFVDALPGNAIGTDQHVPPQLG